MKIVIFTYNFINFGALLQAYALLRRIGGQPGVKVSTLNLFTPAQAARYRIFDSQYAAGIRKIMVYLCVLLRFLPLRRRNAGCMAFRKKYLELTEHCYTSYDEVIASPPEADIYISGSDQVFFPSAPNRRVFYLGFPKPAGGIKAAYAPSFGVSELTPEQEKELKPWIGDFDFLSCREASGAEILSEMTGKKVPAVCDPVFLLSALQWRDIAVPPPEKAEGYIFIYDLNGGHALVEIARAIALQTGLPIICQTQKPQRFYRVNRQIYDCGPQELIGYIAGAAYVVTDSFHGTAFSLIFGRKFFTYTSGNVKTSGRLHHILSRLKLDDRMIASAGDFAFTDAPPHDYREALAAYVAESEDFLETVLAGRGK